MKKLLLFAISCLIFKGVNAQSNGPYYVVTAKGDTLRGRVQLVGKQNNKVRLYRPGIEPIEFGAEEISSYGSNTGPVRVSKKIGLGGPSQFLVPLVVGYASLYTAENEKQEKLYYLQVADSAHVKVVERATHQLTLAQTLPGCPSLNFGSDEIQSRYPYTTQGMIQLIMAYNQCSHPTQPSTVVKHALGWQASFGVKAGINSSRFDLDGISYAGFGERKDATGYQVGASVNFSTLTHFSLQLEANYVQLRGSYGPYELYYYNLGNPENIHTIRINYSQIQIPLLVRYEFGQGVWRPYLNAGPNVAIKISDSSADTFAPTTSPQSDPIEVSKRAFGVAAGGGIMIHRPSSPILSLEMRYNRMNHGVAHTGYAVHLRRQHSIHLVLGIAF
ncbi:hypothetical protein GCM10011375_36290 [Hymenobacter qilianensis]|uniref:PorT family protein n=2 Tax=Hymenobacter qilianensis TaxID=1385715 RepID=A0A7H0GS78_9BACT|nr:porin family protein [Hymenobacter qilianensis]QNP51144.1 PorT family protein [Hymenobacter qilianensis]GGF77950.1 hypothetical protein GCM10011375_36290 [Hymenobacter qilianensis]